MGRFRGRMQAERRHLAILAIAVTALSSMARAGASTPGDDFKDAITIGAVPFSVSADTTDASLEPGEPEDCDGHSPSI
ncbi:MAG: hypothetical protein LC750_17770, partial [Actinobacteria bacterium]|nr:hypothetical protein [Actinomycetota bacterium]